MILDKVCVVSVLSSLKLEWETALHFFILQLSEELNLSLSGNINGENGKRVLGQGRTDRR
jgi:hypothetical protein